MGRMAYLAEWESSWGIKADYPSVLKVAPGSGTYSDDGTTYKYSSGNLMFLHNLKIIPAQKNASCDVKKKTQQAHFSLKFIFSRPAKRSFVYRVIGELKSKFALHKHVEGKK